MFQLPRSNHAFNIAGNARVAAHFQRTKMDIGKKMKELTDLFSKTGKELAEMVKQNQAFISEEIRKAEKTVREATEECSKKHMDRLRAVKDTYSQRIKVCDEKAAEGLRLAKMKYESQIETAEGLRGKVKQILKECLDQEDFVKCLASKTKESARDRKEIVGRLSETVKNAEVSIADHLKQAVKCHAEAKAESLKSLAEILKDIKDCITEKK
ncbi:uncharacterized protein LOC143265078 isoform X2 [Megachile rotundata]|uniref:uncharacterized protein LOC143265078 isoform X2 n=1 Tax=Megachile rotundata TaxID=143995 RepID=UPI003FD054F2